MDRNIKDTLIGLLWGLAICIFLSLVWGCKTKTVVATETHTRDSVATVWRIDSVYMLDSVYVTQYVRGDTVYRDRDKVRYAYKWKAVKDTVIVVRTDTVVKPVIVEKKVVEYKWQTHWYDNVCRVLAALSLVIFFWWITLRVLSKKLP